MNIKIIVYFVLFFIFLHFVLYFFNFDIFDMFDKKTQNNDIQESIDELENSLEQLKEITNN